MIPFSFLHPRATEEHLGAIPFFISTSDPRPAREQFEENYAHGGGWRPMEGWTFNPITNSIHYPGDEPIRPIAVAELREELIFIYPSAWVAILQPEGAFEIARMD